MKKNFTIDKGVYLISEDQVIYDLHNNYTFSHLNILPNQSTVVLIWVRFDGDWVQQNQPVAIVLNFLNINHFEVSDGFIINRSEILQELGYKQQEDRDINWLSREIHFNVKAHLLFRFENDEFIRIHAEKVEMILGT